MKNQKQQLLSLAIVSIAASSLPCQAQISIPSDGSDGALTVAANTTKEIDLRQAVQNSWSSPVPVPDQGKGIWDPSKRAIIFKYDTVNIGNNALVKFINHPNNPPVVWLVKQNVTIAGRISLDGAFPVSTFKLAEPGPGGFRGGAQGTNFGAGLGPGGSNATGSFSNNPASYASKYGNPAIVPLIGGSGSGAGAGNYAGGGGGGAILIACTGTLNLTGSITANEAAPASDGAVRLVVNAITGNGTIDLRDDGRLRIEANSVAGSSLVTLPQAIAITPANPPVIWPADDAPKCRIIKVDTQDTPLNPTASLDQSADVGLAANAGQVVVIQTTKFPVTGQVQVRAAGKFTPNASLINATFQAGDFDQATWTATVPFASGFTTLQARAFVPAAP